MFENIRCTNTQRIPENYGTVYSYSFYSHLGTESWSLVGDADGSDNWSEICDQDSEGSADPETNYPVFDYANNYGVNNNLPGDLANGWYLPSAIELMKIDENFSSVIGAIKKAGGTFIEGSSSEYWASNQNQCFKNNGEEEYHEICIKQAVSVCFGNAKSPNYDYKESSKYVCAIREF